MATKKGDLITKPPLGIVCCVRWTEDDRGLLLNQIVVQVVIWGIPM